MILYIPIKQHLYQEALGHYSSYGIAVCRFPPGRGGGLVPDVSPQLRFALCLALRCTLGGLDPAQLPDVVEDALP